MFLKKAIIFLPLRLIILGALSILFFSFGSSLIPVEAAIKTYDIVIVGGGSGGTSAAIQAARMGSRVAIIEQTDWLGGQMGAAGVSNMDEGGNERNSGIYAEFVQQVAARYGGEQNIHKCYFGSGNICIEPKVVKDVLTQMVSDTGRIDVFYRTKATSVLKNGNTVTGVTSLSTATGVTDTFNAKVVIDATEYGDLLPKAGIAYRVGNTTSSGVNQNACIQDITYTAVAKKYDGGIPSYLQINTPPPGYDNTVESRFAEMVSNTSQKSYADGSGPPFNWKWVRHTAYRGMPDYTRSPNGNTAGSESGANTITKTGINFANDYPAERPYFSGQTTLTARYIEDEAYRTQVNCSAKLKTIQFLYYMQKQGQSWSVADDQGYDTAYNSSENTCANIPSNLKEIEKRLPQAPYVREGRRMIGVSTYTSGQLRAQKKVDRNNAGAVDAADFSSSIAIGGYDDDLHNCNDAGSLEAGLDSIGDKGMGYAPFQVPLESLIPQSVDGFIAAEKNISQSRLVNGATRLQPITMLTGQAAGSLAALAASTNRQPRSVKPIEVQTNLLDANSPLTLYAFSDVAQGSQYWKSANIVSLYSIMTGLNGSFGVTNTLDRGTSAVILSRVFSYPFNGSVDDAITQIRAHGLSSATSNAAYNPSGSLLKGDLAIMIARGLGQFPGNADGAISYLASVGISVECGGGGCVGEGVNRGIMAQAAAGVLKKLNGYTPPPVLQGTIEGFKMLSDGSNNVTINSQPVTLDGGNATTALPHRFTSVPFPAGGTHTVAVPVLSNYSITYRMCYNGSVGHCNEAEVTQIGTSVTIDNNRVIANGGHVDLYWVYTLVPQLQTSVSRDNVTYAQQITTTEQQGYYLKINNLAYTGDLEVKSGDGTVFKWLRAINGVVQVTPQSLLNIPPGSYKAQFRIFVEGQSMNNSWSNQTEVIMSTGLGLSDIELDLSVGVDNTAYGPQITTTEQKGYYVKLNGSTYTGDLEAKVPDGSIFKWLRAVNGMVNVTPQILTGIATGSYKMQLRVWKTGQNDLPWSNQVEVIIVPNNLQLAVSVSPNNASYSAQITTTEQQGYYVKLNNSTFTGDLEAKVPDGSIFKWLRAVNGLVRVTPQNLTGITPGSYKAQFRPWMTGTNTSPWSNQIDVIIQR